jgi:hypothetical protein
MHAIGMISMQESEYRCGDEPGDGCGISIESFCCRSVGIIGLHLEELWLMHSRPHCQWVSVHNCALENRHMVSLFFGVRKDF